MTTLREHALDAWAKQQEKNKQSDLKKRKRKAKKIEEEIEELLPKDWNHCEIDRELADPVYKVVLSVAEANGPLRFTHDEKNKLVVIGECTGCHKEAVSVPVAGAAKLGAVLERFEASHSHECSPKRR